VLPAGARKVVEIGLMGSANNNNNNSNSTLTYLRTKSTVKGTITKLTRVRRKKQEQNTY
jgi:hypothetical protein